MAKERCGSTDISGDCADFARALGGWGERVTQADASCLAIRRAVPHTRQGTPALLELITEKAEDFSLY